MSSPQVLSGDPIGFPPFRHKEARLVQTDFATVFGERGNDEGFISPRTFPWWFNEKPAGNDSSYSDFCLTIGVRRIFVEGPDRLFIKSIDDRMESGDNLRVKFFSLHLIDHL